MLITKAKASRVARWAKLDREAVTLLEVVDDDRNVLVVATVRDLVDSDHVQVLATLRIESVGDDSFGGKELPFSFLPVSYDSYDTGRNPRQRARKLSRGGFATPRPRAGSRDALVNAQWLVSGDVSTLQLLRHQPRSVCTRRARSLLRSATGFAAALEMIDRTCRVLLERLRREHAM